jgi:hypothetical protein
MYAVHNARISLLAIALNNLALSIVVAGFMAPAAGGQLHGSEWVLTTLAWVGGGIVLHAGAQAVLGRLRP